MSKFLGPVHYWLFNKVVLFEELELIIVDEGDKFSAKKFQEEAVALYGEPFDLSLDLADVIDAGNIHGWLQAEINRSEGRHSYIVSKMISEFGTDAKEYVKDIYGAQGRKTAVLGKDKYDVTVPNSILDAVNDFLLDGMPCDRINAVLENSESGVIWQSSRCLHKKFWDLAGGDINDFYEFRTTWLEEFTKGMNEEFTYTFDVNGPLVHKVVR